MKGINLQLTAALVGAILSLASPAGAASWGNKAPMPNPRQGTAVEAINGIVYVVGGYDAGDTPTLQGYDPTTNKWKILASMPGGRYSGDGAGVINSKLYVAGGWTISPPLPNNTLFVYDPISNSWTTKANMSHLSACGATGVINSKLYVATACDGFSGYRNFLDVYDSLTDTWTSLPGSASAHASPAAAVINDKFYVAGGDDGVTGITNILEVFDPVTNGWTTLAPMPVPVINAASAALNGKLYVFGGNDGITDLTTVQVYDPHRNSWQVLTTSLTSARDSASATVVYGLVFVEGGSSNGLLLNTNQDFIIGPSIP